MSVTVKPLSLEERRLCGLDGGLVERMVDNMQRLHYVSPIYSADLLREILVSPQGQFSYLQFYSPSQRIHVLRACGESPDALSLIRMFPFENTSLVVDQCFPGYWYPRLRRESDAPVLGASLHSSIVDMLDRRGKIGLPPSVLVKESYCYLMLFPPVCWGDISSELGPVPRLLDVLEHPLRYTSNMLSIVVVEPGSCVHIGRDGFAHSEPMFRRLALQGARIGGDSNLSCHKPGLVHLAMFSRSDWPLVYEVLGEQPSVHRLLGFIVSRKAEVVGDWSFVRAAHEVKLSRGRLAGVSLLDLMENGYPAWDALPVLSMFVDDVLPTAMTVDEAMSRLSVILSREDKVRLSAHQSLMLYTDTLGSVAQPMRVDSALIDPVKGHVGAYAHYGPGTYLVKFLPSTKWMRMVIQGAKVKVSSCSSMLVDATEVSVCFYGRQDSYLELEVPLSAKVVCTAIHADFFSYRDNLFLSETSVVLCAGTTELTGHRMSFVYSGRNPLVHRFVDVQAGQLHVPPGPLCLVSSQRSLVVEWGVVRWDAKLDRVGYSSVPTGSRVRCSLSFPFAGSISYTGIDDFESFDYDNDPTLDNLPSRSALSISSFSPSVLGDGVTIHEIADALAVTVVPPWSIIIYSDFVELDVVVRSVGLFLPLVRVVLNNSSVEGRLQLSSKSCATACVLSVDSAQYSAVCGALHRDGYLDGSPLLVDEELRVSKRPHSFSVGSGPTHRDYAYLSIANRSDPWVLKDLGPNPSLESLRRKFLLTDLQSQLRRTSRGLVVVESGMGKLGLNDRVGKIIGFG